MEVKRVKSKYCTKDKVQIVSGSAPGVEQIICSNDGYLYLDVTDENIHIHRYLDDPQRKKMPYNSKPVSAIHLNHLFKFNKIYARFIRETNKWSFTNRYKLTFLYFLKNKKIKLFLQNLVYQILTWKRKVVLRI